MNQRQTRWLAVALACLLVAACQDKHQPLKPTVQPAATTAAA